MQLTTSKGKTYEARFAGGPTFISGAVMGEIQDGRPLHEIAAELEGLEWLESHPASSPEKRWEGYTVLQSISRPRENAVQFSLTKP